MRLNPRQLEQMMKQMGIQQKEIEALKVVIETPTKNIIIMNPAVSKVNVMGQETWQIAGGEIYEEARNPEKIEISEEDIKMVVEQTGVSEEKAREVLEETNGDLAEAILKLKESN